MMFGHNSRVITRMRGDIPGCVAAVDIYVGISQQEIYKWNSDYQKVWDDYRFGVIGFSEWKNHAIHRRELPSPIKNKWGKVQR